MSTLKLMTWAFALSGVEPLEKLIAVYFAANAAAADAGDAEITIDVVELGTWCGCKKEEAYHTLLRLEKFGWRVDEIEPFRKLHISFELSSEGAPVRSEPNRGPLTLYVVATDQAVKIGITGDLPSRLKNFATSMPLAVRVCLKASGPRDAIAYVERGCHAELVPHRIRGEWFSCSVETATAVARDWLRKVGLEPDQA